MSSFIANTHNELYVFHTGKGGLLRKEILSQWWSAPTAFESATGSATALRARHSRVVVWAEPQLKLNLAQIAPSKSTFCVWHLKWHTLRPSQISRNFDQTFNSPKTWEIDFQIAVLEDARLRSDDVTCARCVWICVFEHFAVCCFIYILDKRLNVDWKQYRNVVLLSTI